MTGVGVLHGVVPLRALRAEWDALAETPFGTVEWLAAWFDAFGKRPFVTVSRDASGAVVAAAAFHRRPGLLAAAANTYSSDWDVLAVDAEERSRMWHAIAATAPPRLTVRALRADRAAAARTALATAGYDVVTADDLQSPTLHLPPTYDELLASVSRTLRQQVRRRTRALERAGQVVMRTNRGDASLEDDLDAFLRVEASGWKAQAGTALLHDAPARACFCGFARDAARAGWLRLRLLELDGVVVAGDLSCAYAGAEWLLKTGYDERYAALRPGFVLRAEALRAAIEEGSSRYEFLGGPDPYKVRWADGVERRVVLRASRGVARPLSWWARGRPRLARGARRVAARAGGIAGWAR